MSASTLNLPKPNADFPETAGPGPSVGLLITNYNTWDLVDRCITQSLRWSGSSIHEVVVVDDHSPTLNYLTFDPRVRVIRNETNLGYVKSINVGFRHLHTDIVIILDSDAYPLHDYIPLLLKTFAQNPSVGLIGFYNVDENGTPTGSYEAEPSVWGLILGQTLEHRFTQWVGRRTRKDDWICPYSCSVAYRRECLTDVGLNDEGFGYLDADHDHAMRINRSAWRAIHCPDIRIYHKGGQSVTKNHKRVLMFYQSRWRLLQKYQKIKARWLVKHLIIGRLYGEYTFLKLLGRFRFKDRDLLTDKLLGRQKLIDWCRKHY